MRGRLLFVLAALALFGGASITPAAAQQLPEQPGAWVQITPEPTRIDGRMIDPTCSDAPESNPEFRFWARRGTGDGLIVFFAGGGACWDDITCSVPRMANDRPDDGFYSAELHPNDLPARFSGIFDLDNPSNPIRDWSFVYVPYCTGDVHSGANTATYTNPDTGERFTIQHRGADNFRVILAWMRENFSQPAHLLVAGSSAGAYGAATHYARIRAAYPRGQAAFIGDAGQGVMTEEFFEQRDRSWRYDVPRSLFSRNDPPEYGDDLVARLAARYPRDRFAQVTSANDFTQTAFYALMGGENACASWNDKMMRELRARERAANFNAYVAAGQAHTILRSPVFYTEQSGGVAFAAWFSALLSDSGAGWDPRATQVQATSQSPERRCMF